jgi:hypothetical protein
LASGAPRPPHWTALHRPVTVTVEGSPTRLRRFNTQVPQNGERRIITSSLSYTCKPDSGKDKEVRLTSLRMELGLLAFILIVTAAAVLPLCAIANEPPARFESTERTIIEIAFPPASLQVGKSHADLHDCSNDTTICYYDDDGFRLAFFRKCSDLNDTRSPIRFRPILVRVLDNWAWYVYKEAPHYMFQYLWSAGVVGIYFDPKGHYDFRELENNNTSLARMDRFIFRKISGGTLAACTW